MNIRAVLFDIYNTLLVIGPPLTDAPARWDRLWQEAFRVRAARVSLEEFASASERVIVREHASARAAGIAFPEIFWPAVAGEALPELAALSASSADEFLFAHAQLTRGVGLPDAAAALLVQARAAGLRLGLVSNCQPYTLRELDTALAAAGLDRALFASELCFFSFQAGFSKPDPHVFRWLAARLRAAGIGAEETLVVGDRLDNDIEPARRQGFATWRLTQAAGDGRVEGNWFQLARRLALP
jgi:FMN phosphatase YigB (HAD superfamily)